MKRLCPFLAAVFVTGLCHAQAPPEAVARFSFDLDVPAGHYSYWAAEDLPSVRGLVARVAVTELRSHPEWTPLFGFHLLGEGGPDGARVSLQFSPTPDRRALVPSLSVFVPGAPAPHGVRLAAPFALGDTVVVRLGWSPEGGVTAAVGPESASVEAPWPQPSQLCVTASSGQMKAFRLELLGRPEEEQQRP